MREGGQRHAPDAVPPGKIRYPLYRRLGWPQGWSGQVRKISPFTGIRYHDRPTRSGSLYRLSYPGPWDGENKCWLYYNDERHNLQYPENAITEINIVPV